MHSFSVLFLVFAGFFLILSNAAPTRPRPPPDYYGIDPLVVGVERVAKAGENSARISAVQEKPFSGATIFKTTSPLHDGLERGFHMDAYSAAEDETLLSITSSTSTSQEIAIPVIRCASPLPADDMMDNGRKNKMHGRTRRQRRGVPAILVELFSRLGSTSEKFKTKTLNMAEEENIVDLAIQTTEEIEVILTQAIIELKYLVAHPYDSFLGCDDRTIPIDEVSQLVATVYSVIIPPLTIIKPIISSKFTLHAPLIGKVDYLLSELLSTLFLFRAGY
ncbi:hypothetical protein BDQ12DRAFT_362190 [Crucibulum laeve]|uniref:Uncharacterized protein n=1 Tax=Crucibulum laeve TaxID=68775 RepID=A0A5C3LQU5_9AGAR|nr:hypothetical protein BDQ12DRAFT_362190 [Crucibulum laeve]